MSYQQPPAPQGPPPGMPHGAPAGVPPGMPYGAPPGAMSPGMPPQRNAKALVGALLVATALVLMLVALLGHSWLLPREDPGSGTSTDTGLWSTVEEGDGRSETTTHLEALDDSPGNDFTLFAAGSLAFFALNWILLLLLAIAGALGFARFASGKSAGAPFILSMITASLSVFLFLVWFFVAVLGSDALDDSKLGGSVWLWWAGPVLTIVATVLFGLARQRTFGHGFQDRKSTRLNSSHRLTSRMPSSA
jgi:hypothetical protein